MTEEEKIRERWPFLFPLDRGKGELADAIVQANSDVQALFTLLDQEREKTKQMANELRALLKSYEKQISYAFQRECEEVLKQVEGGN